MTEQHRILVTGGAGYVGSACLRHLLRQGIEAWAYDDLSSGNPEAVPEGRLIRGDILDPAALRAALRAHRITAVLHAAALVSVPESFDDPESYWRINFEGTRTVLDAICAEAVGRIVFSSTAAVYRHGARQPLREEDPLEPATPYGASKLAAAYLVRDTAVRHGLKAVEFRYFNAAGADLDGTHGEARPHETHAVPLLLQTAAGRRAQFSMFGTDFDTPDGTCIRDYIAISDLAEAHLRALTWPLSEPFVSCNLGGGTGVSVRTLLGAAEAATGRVIPHQAAGRRAGDSAWLVADISRAARLLDWQPQIPLTQILTSAWAWYSSHPQGYGAGAGAGAGVGTGAGVGSETGAGIELGARAGTGPETRISAGAPHSTPV